jgi:hypothetical protein
MSFEWNKVTQKLFWWKNTQIEPATGINMQENKEERKINLALLNTHNNLKKFYREINILKEFYMSQMMINRIIDDSLNPSASDNEIFKVTILNDDGSENELATKEARILKRNLNIERMLLDIAPDILAYGSHYLRLDINTWDSDNVLKGIINIHDDVDPATIIPVWRDSEIIYYNVIKNGKIEKAMPYEYVFFGFGTERIKVEVDLNDDQAIYFRVGMGLLKPVLHLLRTLYLLEGLVYVNLLKKESKQPIISVTVPENISPDKAVEVSKSYEKLLNKNLNDVEIDFEDIQQTLENILENTSKVKVIPDWGSKGQLQKQDLEVYSDLEDIFTKIEDLRNVILQTNGFPASLFESESVQRIDLIQNNVRYTKKIKTFHQSLRNGLAHLFLIHLKNQNFDVSLKNIKIDFVNVINTSDLEKIEYVSMVIDAMSNIKDFVDDIAENSEELGVNVNRKSLINFYNNTFKRLFAD